MRSVPPNGPKVAQLRIERNLSQEELAMRAGYAKRTIENVEAGKPVYPKTLADIAEALGPDVRMNDLIAREERESNPESIATEGVLSSERIGNAPPLPSLLVGRETDLSKLIGRLTRAASGQGPTTQVITAIRGWAGVGKTSVARAIAHAPALAQAFPEGVLWASLGPSPSIPAELIAWGRAMGDRDLLLAKDIGEVSHRLAGLLRNRRMLLIVDDVWEAHHAVPFNVGGSQCAMLVTTRHSKVADALSPTPDDIYRLDVLSEDESLNLLETLATEVVRDSREECRELARALEGLPLALQVAGRMLRAERAHGWDVARLLAELRDDAAKLLQQRAPADMAAPGDVSPTVSALLQKSTDCLDPVIRKRFAYLAPFAPRPAVFELDDLMAVWKVNEAVTRETVDVLVDRGLLEPLGDREYQIHQVLVLHAKTLLKKPR